MSSFSSVYASVKAGQHSASAPYVAPETAVCKRCGAKVSRQVEAIEAHEAQCSSASRSTSSRALLLSAASPEESLPRSFSSTSMELEETALGERLASESRHLFEEEEEKSTSVAGWERYSARFGAGRMGLEFEYDGRGTRRLVVTRVSREASSLGVRARDVLIGIGNRPVPRATDPTAVHRHLLTCERPVVLHFYRLHVRRKEPELAGAARAVWDRLPTVFQRAEPPQPEELREEARLDSEGDDPEPTVLANPRRYYDDEGEFETCVANGARRAALASALKPMLRMRPWRLLYDSSVDGMCLEALYAHAREADAGPQLLLVRDDRRNVAGAFVDERLRNAGDYFGTGECFVFNFSETDQCQVYRWVGPYPLDDDARDRADSADGHAPLGDDHPAFNPPDPPPLPSIENDMFVYSRDDVLGFGSGGGGFAIRLDDALEVGASRPCATYGTPHSLFDGRDTFPVNRVQLFEFASQFATS
mmetsp:Transcript_4171/g.12764  ORF Transcript_4171/g.12764 Transcript_4171/m.12764 type:complete len:477 (+) Transcript_4171:133-1563(+)